MKKIVGLMLFLSCLVISFISENAKVNAIILSDYEYSVSNNEVTITGYTGESTVISIPDQIDGMVVTRIGDDAFYGANLTSVIIPNTVTAIGSTAFYGNQLTSVTIPDSVLTISDRVFTSNAIEELILNNGIQSIGDYAFSSNQLVSITIPDGVTFIGEGAFFYNLITNVSLPSSLTSISNAAFMSNELTSIVIPNNVTTINNGAFHSNNLTSVTIPEGVTRIGEDAFSINQLASITLPNSVIAIDNSAFSYNQLTSLTLPNSVTTLGAGAFSDNQLTNVTLSDNLTSIPYGAFHSNNLIDITIPVSVTSINDYAFTNNNLSTITFQGNISILNLDSISSQTKFGYTFKNWYSDETQETAWDFSNSIAANTTLYAGYDINTHTVSFNSNGGSVITDITSVNYNSSIEAPTVPTKSGYTFAGWYKDAVLTSQWDFTTDVVTEDIALFAKWNRSGGNNTYTPPMIIPTPTPDPTPTPAPTTSPVPTFNDVKGHWAEKTILQAVEQGITSGYTDGSFRPNEQVTREEFAVMLAKALNLDSEGQSLAFSDGGNIGAWAIDAIERAVQHGLINGYPDGSFRPQAHVSRAELAVMLAHALGEVSPEENSGYKDDARIPTWAKASVTVLKQYGIMQGRVGNLFDAQGITTRAEALTALMKLLALK